MENIFKTDENYMYGELRKYDENYDRITSIIEEEITNPNLRKNGGILFGTVGLYYPESLIYMKDVLTDSIVGYMGLTQNYGKGLYISQIAVRKESSLPMEKICSTQSWWIILLFFLLI